MTVDNIEKESVGIIKEEKKIKHQTAKYPKNIHKNINDFKYYYTIIIVSLILVSASLIFIFLSDGFIINTFNDTYVTEEVIKTEKNEPVAIIDTLIESDFFEEIEDGKIKEEEDVYAEELSIDIYKDSRLSKKAFNIQTTHPTGFYVVLGTLRTKKKANQKIISKKLDEHCIVISIKNKHRICYPVYGSDEQIKKEFKVLKNSINNKAWLLFNSKI